MAWTSDGYALAVGYEHAWAVWTVGGRLNGWGMALAEGDGRGRGGEGFLHGVIDLVRCSLAPLGSVMGVKEMTMSCGIGGNTLSGQEAKS